MMQSDRTPTTNVKLASNSNLLMVLLRRWTKNGANLLLLVDNFSSLIAESPSTGSG